MNPLAWTWIELAITVPFIGAVVVRLFREPLVADRIAISCTAFALASALIAWLGFHLGVPVNSLVPNQWLTRAPFEIDEFNAPLIPLVAGIHLLTVLMTPRVKMNRMSYTGHLIGESIRLSIVSCLQPWLLIALMIVGCVPPAVELINRARSIRIYAIHMCLFALLLILGWWQIERGSELGIVLLFAAILVRTGCVPTHLWFADLLQNASFGTALLYLTPIASVYTTFRLVIPIAPTWVLEMLGILSLVTAILAGGLAVVQVDVRRFMSFIMLSQSSLILVGLELRTATSLTGALCLWMSSIVAVGGFGLILRAVEARFGKLDLRRHHGLYDHAPPLAIGFLLMGLSSIGFPGTFGFIAAELLMDGAIEANIMIGLGLILAAMLNGIAILRVYFLIFTGERSTSTTPIILKDRKKYSILALCIVVLAGALISSTIVTNRHSAALGVLEGRGNPESRAGANSD